MILSKNAKVAILAPSAQIGDIGKIEKGLNYLKSIGLVPVLGENTLKQYRYMAGTDKQRADDINSAFADSEIKAIFCVRAAAGALRILPYLDYELIKKNPKPIIGFCDNAALQAAVYEKSGICSLNGFSLTYDFKSDELDEKIKKSFENIIFGKNEEIISGKCRQSGHAEGRLICANLTTLLYLAGSGYFPSLSGKILLIEDVHERMHRIDMMLQQLKQQPDFDKLNGIILGQFTDIQGDEEDGSLENCFNDFLQDVNVPVIQNFEFGHTKSRYVLPFGARVIMNADECRLSLKGF